MKRTARENMAGKSADLASHHASLTMHLLQKLLLAIDLDAVAQYTTPTPCEGPQEYTC